ncbi:hemicentin-1-like isoform X1 [Sparus aurata]|nr:hemicentin-1-like isoform X1 [Sparus aurata]
MSGFKLPPTALESLFLGLCLLTSVGKTLGNDNGVRVVVEEDSDAVLPCSLSTKEDITGMLFDWKKDGQKEVFMYDSGKNNANRGQNLQFKGRVSHFQDQLMNGNASIKIQNVNMADSGIYRCIFPHLQPRKTFNIELVVERNLKDRSGEIPGASKPFITTPNQTKDQLLLQCEVEGASQEPKVEWQDSSGNILPAEEPQVSERGGRYYVTINTTVTKTDRYRCVVTQKEISHQTSAETFVFISGASPEPYITTLNETKDWSLLQCKVRGASQEPKVEWQDSSGNILPAEEPQVSERGGRYYVTINTTVTKTGRYRCVVTQKEINHQSRAETFVFISGASPEPYITTPDATKDWSLLQCEVKGASPEPKVEWQDSSGNILPAEEPQVSERGGRYYVTIKTNVTKTGRYRCVVTQEGISHQTSAETFVFINVNSSSVSEKVCEDCSSAVAFVLGAAVLAVVVAAVPFGLRATNCITVSFNQGAAPDPTTTSNDPTKDIPLLQVRVTGDHQDQNGSSNAP